tara:strand:+ start:47 stop:466 length:420 start_codon:yes stop_codon:yes gene_type:complete
MNKEIKGEDALRKLIEIKDKKIWDMNLEIGSMTSELVNLRGAHGVVVKLSAEIKDLEATIKALENSLANALAEDHRQKQADEIIMTKMERINDLEAINESHKKINGRLQERLTEVEEDNKKLAQQIDDSVNRMRKAGVI